MEVEAARAKSARSPQRGSKYGGGAFPTRAPTLLTGYHTSPGGRLVDQSVRLSYRCLEGLKTAVTVRAMEEDQMSPETMVVTVVGAGGKMGMRILREPGTQPSLGLLLRELPSGPRPGPRRRTAAQ